MRKLCRVLLLAALVLASASSLYASNCLQQVGEPYEKGDQVCIKVENTCNQIVPISWSVTTHNFGIQGSSNAGTASGTKAIAPNATIEVCSDKPDDSGTFCFFFKIKNFDRQKPYDRFYDWLNNIEVAMIGGNGYGVFEVGGSGFVTEDVVLAVEAPAGWSMALSTTHVAAASFPAAVEYVIVGPEGEDAVLKVVGIGAETGEVVGDASFTIVAQGDLPPGDNEPVPGDGDPKDPVPTEEVVPVLTFSNAKSGGAVDATLLFAWNEAGVFTPVPQATFEVYGPSGWELIADETDRPAGADFGIATALWDTTSLPAGDYRVRVTMTGEAGQVGQAEEVITVLKRPEAVPTATRIRETTFVFDARDSFDPDGTIVDWQWKLGDGRLATGPTVRHTYREPGSYPVNVTVVDDSGLETTAYCLADTQAGVFACLARSCGCESMEIRGDGTTSAIEHPEYVGGGNDNGPQVPGGGSNTLNYKFEVLAKLKPGSDPGECDFKQWVKGTITVDGTEYPKEHDGEEYPIGGDSYGEDGPKEGFHKAEPNADPPTIRWVDGPGLWTVPTGKSASLTGEFFAMVTGPEGTCQCSWKVDMAIAADGTVTRPPTLTDVNCS
ncbi:MAG: PKD domain-containing protein [Acidobacteriota bacterium]